MVEIPVELGDERYAITIGRGALRALPDLLSLRSGRPVAAVASRRVFSLHGRALAKPLRALGAGDPLLVPDGERYKNAATLGRIYDGLVARRFPRDGLLLVVGGGVVGDLAGYAAASYMRGVDWAVVPTTLLAMVDSAIGGKVGLNHARGKNLIGAFHQPRAVIVDPSFLETLPPREVQSGSYEMVKCGVLADRALFAALAAAPERLLAWERTELEKAIAAACLVKAEVVGRDEREGGLRRVLNLGHTLGHALETVTRYRRFTHGEAVGWGLLGAAWIARERGLLGHAEHLAVAAAVDRRGGRPRVSDLRPAAILEALKHDKKVREGRLAFILPTEVGAVTVTNDVTDDEVRGALGALAERE